MSTTVTEKLTEIKIYAKSLFPTYRPQVLLDPMHQAYINGYDQAHHDIQAELLEILESD